MIKFLFLLSAILMASCATHRSFPYSGDGGDALATLKIKDAYAENFVFIPLITSYRTKLDIFDGGGGCPYTNPPKYNNYGASGYEGSIKLTKSKPEVLLNIKGSLTKYLDIERSDNTGGTIISCTSSYRLDMEAGRDYYFHYDGKTCRASLYEIASSDGELIRLDLAGSGSAAGDARLCK